MSKTFKVGDIVVITRCEHHHQFLGKEATITESGLIGLDVNGNKFFGCRLDFHVPNGELAVAKFDQIRHKQSPRREQDEVVNWESVGWMPMDVKLDRAIKQALKDNVKKRA